MSSNQAEINRIFREFTQEVIRENKNYNSQELFWHILSWTEGNFQLTIKLCRYVLRYPGDLTPGRESIFIEQLFTNYVLREPEIKKLSTDFKERIYRQKFTTVVNQNQGVISSRSRFELINVHQKLGLSLQQVEQVEQSALRFFVKQLPSSTNSDRQSQTFVENPIQPVRVNYPANQENISAIATTSQVNYTPTELVVSIQQELRTGRGKQQQRKLSKKWFLLLLLTLIVLIVVWLNKKNINNNIIARNQSLTNNFCSEIEQKVSNHRMSLGEKLLSRNSAEFSDPQFTQAVERGIDAFANCEFEKAITYLEKSVKLYKNNPEIVIYLNNAQAATKPSLRIAVSVSIGSQRAIALEMLRGIAQAQAEINREGGINGKLLSVQIANDDNQPEIAKKIATQLVRQPEVLAMVGHNSSDASLAASAIYQQGKLVMVTPTSSATELSAVGDYIFSTIPDIRALADALGHYIVKSAKKNIAFCDDSNSVASQSFLQEFSRAVEENQGEIIAIGCDFASANFNPHQISFQELSQQAQALLLLPSVDNIRKAIAVAQVNQQQLPLLGNHSMYTFETIQEGQADVNEMILPVPWQSGSIPNNSFPQKARQMWGGDVNWRTAMAYDATNAIIQGLKEAETRQGLQAALADSRFAVNGATGPFGFEHGDRKGQILLVKIKHTKSTGNNNYQFFPIK